MPAIRNHQDQLLHPAELYGDPEGKLAADALLGGERETDQDGVKAIRDRLDEIEELAATTGGSETVESEKAALLTKLRDALDGKQVRSLLMSAHHNIASQIRTFRRDKLPNGMPQLAAHLQAHLKLDFPHFGYYPPAGTLPWKS